MRLSAGLGCPRLRRLLGRLSRSLWLLRRLL